MKAITYSKYGATDVLHLTEQPKPEIKPNEVLVKVVGAGVNPADWRFRKGQFRWGMPLKFPFIPGNDVAGVLEQIGTAVSSMRIGDMAYGMTELKQGGTCAEYVAMNEKLLVKAPEKIPLVDTAAIPLAGLTALQALQTHAGLRSGQNVLIIGASGGVGHFGVQIGKALGAQVTGCTSQKNFEFVLGCGADAVVDYADPKQFRGDSTYDVIFDTVTVENFTRWRKALKPGGVIVTVHPIIGKILPVFVTRLFGVAKLHSFFVRPDRNDLLTLKEMVDSGKLRPRIEKRFDLIAVPEAHRLSETCRVRGKLLITIKP
jgi:NADPH:quinone reductase-like Zn-dependent oxidoreductase